jgi:hypothetical protein
MPTNNNIQFAIHNKQDAVHIDESLWTRAFNYAVKKLQIEYHRAMIDCFFVRKDIERIIKFKHFSAGASSATQKGAMFYVVAESFLTDGSMVKTFFHEMMHVKQLVMGELKVTPHRLYWKKEIWDRHEYSFAPWEEQARAFADTAYDKFLRQKVTRLMADDNVHAYDPSITKLQKMFPVDDVYRITQEVHRELENRQSSISNFTGE